MEMKLTFAPFIFASRGRKFQALYEAAHAKPYPPESLLRSATSRATDLASLSRMSLSSLLYHALIGDDTTVQ